MGPKSRRIARRKGQNAVSFFSPAPGSRAGRDATPLLEKTFGFGSPHRVGPAVRPDPATIGGNRKRRYVPNLQGYRRIRSRGGGRAIVAVGCTDRFGHVG